MEYLAAVKKNKEYTYQLIESVFQDIVLRKKNQSVKHKIYCFLCKKRKGNWKIHVSGLFFKGNSGRINQKTLGFWGEWNGRG